MSRHATGFSYPQGSDERFQSVVYISSSSPKLAWRNRIDRSDLGPTCFGVYDDARKPSIAW
jgi:hypothetical protein